MRAPSNCLARAAVLLTLLSACSGNGDHSGATAPGAGGEGGGEGNPALEYSPELPYARSVESFDPGVDAGFNQQKLPDIVLGPPGGVVSGGGSLDVVSLGAGGSIVLGFGDKAISDGAGPDFVVFENPFWPGGDASQVYAELGEVSVSEDGETWQTFRCDPIGDGQGHFPGCAGFTPTQKYDPATLVPLDAARTGGDGFDLAELGVTRARFVKIHDLATLEPSGTNAGFDLDAVGIVNVEE